jgi:hypothetical protein
MGILKASEGAKRLAGILRTSMRTEGIRQEAHCDVQLWDRIANVPCPLRLSLWVGGTRGCEDRAGVDEDDINIVVVVSGDVDRRHIGRL